MLTIQQYFLVHYNLFKLLFAICSYVMTEILLIWQASQHLNGVQGPTFCISAMILV